MKGKKSPVQQGRKGSEDGVQKDTTNQDDSNASSNEYSFGGLRNIDDILNNDDELLDTSDEDNGCCKTRQNFQEQQEHADQECPSGSDGVWTDSSSEDEARDSLADHEKEESSEVAAYVLDDNGKDELSDVGTYIDDNDESEDDVFSEETKDKQSEYSSSDESDVVTSSSTTNPPSNVPVSPTRKQVRKVCEPVKRKPSRYDSIESFKKLGSLQAEMDLCGGAEVNKRYSSNYQSLIYFEKDLVEIEAITTEGVLEGDVFSKTGEQHSSSIQQDGRVEELEEEETSTYHRIVQQVVRMMEKGYEENVVEILLWTPLVLMVLYIVFVESSSLFHGTLTQ